MKFLKVRSDQKLVNNRYDQKPDGMYMMMLCEFHNLMHV